MRQEILNKALNQCALFEDISESDRSALLEIAMEKHLAKKAPLFSEGDQADGFYLILSGSVKVFKISPDGKEHILHIFGPGEPVGEVPVFSGKEFPAFAEAVRDSEVYFIEKDRLLRDLEHVPGLARDFITLLARKCVTLNRRIEALGLQTVRQRLVQFLLMRCQML